MQNSELKNIEELIQRMACLASESPIYEKLAHFIEQNYLRIIFMTAEETAINSGVSQGSVSRFCATLGYKGYNDFLRNLQKVVSEEITAPQRYFYTTKSNGKANDIIEKEARNISVLNEILKGDSYEYLLKTIIESKRLVLLSARMSATLLPYMKYILDKMRNDVEVIIPESTEWDRFYLKDPAKTSIIAVGFPRYSKVLLNKLKEVRELGFSINLITDSRLSSFVPFATNSIYVPITVSSLFDLYSTPMAFINLMLRDAAKNIPNLDKRLATIESYDKDNNAFYNLKQ